MQERNASLIAMIIFDADYTVAVQSFRDIYKHLHLLVTLCSKPVSLERQCSSCSHPVQPLEALVRLVISST